MTKREKAKFDKEHAKFMRAKLDARSARAEKFLASILTWNDDYAFETAQGLCWARDKNLKGFDEALRARIWIAFKYAERFEAYGSEWLR